MINIMKCLDNNKKIINRKWNNKNKKLKLNFQQKNKLYKMRISNKLNNNKININNKLKLQKKNEINKMIKLDYYTKIVKIRLKKFKIFKSKLVNKNKN